LLCGHQRREAALQSRHSWRCLPCTHRAHSWHWAGILPCLHCTASSSADLQCLGSALCWPSTGCGRPPIACLSSLAACRFAHAVRARREVHRRGHRELRHAAAATDATRRAPPARTRARTGHTPGSGRPPPAPSSPRPPANPWPRRPASQGRACARGVRARPRGEPSLPRRAARRAGRRTPARPPPLRARRTPHGPAARRPAPCLGPLVRAAFPSPHQPPQEGQGTPPFFIFFFEKWQRVLLYGPHIRQCLRKRAASASRRWAAAARTRSRPGSAASRRR